MDWRKFLSTEWIAFLLIYAAATYGLFTRFIGGNEWGITVVGAATQLVYVRWHKKRTQLEYGERYPGEPDSPTSPEIPRAKGGG